jgi:predicted transcriptional regulator
MKITELSLATLNYIKDNGGKVAVDALATGLGRTVRSVNASVTDLSNKKLVVREKEAGTGEDAKEITYAVITDAGVTFVPETAAE